MLYITVKTIKRNIGFKGIEIADIVIGFPLVAICVILFTLTPLKMPALVLLMVGIFLLLPISVSKKNRMYKVLFLLFQFIVKTKVYIYSMEIDKTQRGMILTDGIRQKIRKIEIKRA